MTSSEISSAAASARDLGLGLLVLAGAGSLGVLLARTSALAGQVTAPAGDHAPGRGIEDVLVATVTGLGAAVAGWYALSAVMAVLCALTGLVGGTWRAGEEAVRRHGAPGVARLVGAGTGAVLATGLALSPVQAEAPAPAPEPTIAEDLTWAAAAAQEEGATEPPATDRPSDGTAPATEEPSAEPPPALRSASGAGSTGEPAARAGEHVVRPGDTLWEIAASRLPAGADDAQVAAAWPRWYAANAAAIGPDPDLILPGTVLRPPD